MHNRVRIGVVSDNRDPEKRCRIKVGLKDILGDDAGNPEEHPDWIEPAVPFVGKDSSGWIFIPSVGTEVEVEFHGDDDQLIEEMYVRYRACLYKNKDSIPEDFKTNYPQRYGIVTPGGHTILFDDKGGSEIVEIKHKDGTEILIKDGKIYLGAESGAGKLVTHAEMLTLFNGHQHNTLLVEAGLTTILSSTPTTAMSDTQATDVVYAK